MNKDSIVFTGKNWTLTLGTGYAGHGTYAFQANLDTQDTGDYGSSISGDVRLNSQYDYVSIETVDEALRRLQDEIEPQALGRNRESHLARISALEDQVAKLQEEVNVIKGALADEDALLDAHEFIQSMRLMLTPREKHTWGSRSVS